ncbi:MAG: tetratricopeptide repeat protein, partial [Flavobacteriales bacterium]|nr:tetratricopeptide repeat protein [Flavobacteriales bacterium]
MTIRASILLLAGFFSIATLSNVYGLDSLEVDSLENIINTAEEDTVIADAMNKIAWSYIYSYPDKALPLAEKEYKVAERAAASNDAARSRKGRELMALALNTQAACFWVKGDYRVALKRFQMSLERYLALNNDDAASKIHNNIGALYHQIGEYPKALESYLRSIKIDEKNENLKSMAITYHNIGLICYAQRDLDRALDYMNRVLELNKGNLRTRKMAAVIGNIALVYWKIGESAPDDSTKSAYYTLALEQHFLALEIDEEVGNKNGIARHFINIGIVYKNMGDREKAEEFYLKAHDRYAEIGAQRELTVVKGDIGLLFLDYGKKIEAERYFREALNIADSIGYMEGIKDWNLSLAELHEQNGNYLEAYNHYGRYTAAKDSLFNEQKSKEIGKLEAKHEFETAETERKRAEEELYRKEARAKSRRDNLQYSGILIFLVLIFAAVFMLGRFSIPIRLAEGMIFFSFLLFFEFTLVLLDPYIEQYSSGAPAVKLGFNALLAAMIFPLHSLFENKLKGR